MGRAGLGVRGAEGLGPVVVRGGIALLAPAVTLAAYFHWMSTREEGYWEKTSGRRTTIRIVAAVSLLLWLGVAMMGRWIAYADYLFPPE